MKLDNTAGFTIIETMLFLGITGLLVMGILVGAGTSINIQRYRDSITSLQSVVQQQYSEVSNVSNDSLANDCYGDSSTNNPRGQSDCVILGRFITTTDSQTLSIKSVIGYIPSGSLISSWDDVAALNQYDVQISPVSSETYSMEWGSSIVAQGSNNPMVFSILILRSPTSGIVRTFIDPSTVVSDSNVATLVTKPALAQTAKLCVANPSGLLAGGKSAVVVTTNATSASGIETLGEAISGC